MPVAGAFVKDTITSAVKKSSPSSPVSGVPLSLQPETSLVVMAAMPQLNTEAKLPESITSALLKVGLAPNVTVCELDVAVNVNAAMLQESKAGVVVLT